MLFNSLTFIIFFAIVLPLYYILPQRLKWVMLLIASYIFYMFWRPEFIILIIFSTFVNYFIAGLIYMTQNKKSRKLFLIISIIINFGLLFIFKYLVFVNHSFMSLFEALGLHYPIKDFDIILPMGISFYTFQAASYTIDVYNGKYKRELNFFKFSLYITFFPQLVAGPIERADRLMGQLFSQKKYNINNITNGLKIMLWGFFKKIVIADRVAVLVNTVYNSPKDFSGLAYIIATLFFTFQIYCDFSGYSDIAIGCAKTLDIDLMQNFNRPYFSKSIKEFWRRWHISLSTWFKDYVYIPLGGSRCSKFKTYINLMITFIVSGIWHGANWTFIIWGALHGIYQIIGNIKDMLFSKVKTDLFIFSPFKILITFVLVMFAWIFFRANSISDAFYIISNIFTDFNQLTNHQYIYETLNSLGLNIFEILICIATIGILIFVELLEFKNSIHIALMKVPFVFRFAFYYIIAILILTLGVYDDVGEFIYFQF